MNKNVIKFLLLFIFCTTLAYADQDTDIRNWLENEVKNYLIQTDPALSTQMIQVNLQSTSLKTDDIKKGNLLINCRKQGKITGKTLFTASYTDSPSLSGFHIVADVIRYENVVVLRKAIDRFHVIQASDVVIQTMQVNWSSSANPVQYDNVIGMRTKRAIPQGRVLLTSMVETLPMIKRGEQVKMNMDIKNISISLPVVSQGKGGKGDVIKVRDAINGTYYYAEIINPSTVVFKSNKR